ncbi:hypothetical protein [Capnocytophaga granulosa]|uniref:hypothetical protein n=1 Tax=Capnocytophaga granulosa TaxID=45242 RepID=UPI0023F24DC9|nr:hypothetical protein [Capnocytophaga granulosa]
MEEALSILWTYARRQPIESNGKTIVATISQSIAAIRIIMRLEGWLQKNEERESEGRESEKRKMMSEVPETKPSENLESGYVEEKNKVYEPFAQPQLAHAAESLQLVPTNDRACSTSILTESITFDRYELQSHASERATKSASTYLVAPSPSERGLGERISAQKGLGERISAQRDLKERISAQRGFGERIRLPYHEVLSRFAKVSYTMSKARKPYHSNLRVQVAGLSIQATCNQQKKQRRNAACKVKESKSISPYEYSCAVSHKHSKAAALMLDKNRIRPPCVALIINGINH